MKELTLYTVTPSYNEKKNLPLLIEELRTLKISKVSVSSLIVDDGSNDQTSEILSSFEGDVLTHPFNLGIGAAVQSGVRYALSNGAHYIAQVDADLQHIPDELHKLMPPLLKDEADVVIGSRFLKTKDIRNSGTSLARYIGGRLFSRCIQWILGIKITDPTSGFRAYNRKAAELIGEHYADDYPEVEALALFRKHELRIVEIPVVMRSRYYGVSSISFTKSMYYMVKVLVALAISAFRREDING